VRVDGFESPTLQKYQLPAYIKDFKQYSSTCFYNVTTLYFEVEQEDDLHKTGFRNDKMNLLMIMFNEEQQPTFALLLSPIKFIKNQNGN
jgi:hypothetical protein